MSKNITVLDLREAVVLGVVSGGTTTFYMRGMYHERSKEEKKKMIKPYLEAYLKQIMNKKDSIGK